MLDDLRRLADELALAAVGIAPADSEVTAAYPWVRCVICCAVCYLPPDRQPPDDAPRGRVARVAQSADYHDVLRGKLSSLAAKLSDALPGRRFEVCVDTCPLPERKLAVLAGIAWQGKSGNVFIDGCGSYAALGEIVTDADLPPSETLLEDHCGDCELCISACPAGALTAPYSLDTARCLSALTQSPGSVPRYLRKAMGTRIYGCDECLAACPHNAALSTGAPEFGQEMFPGPYPELIPLIRMTAQQFRERVEGSSIGWIRRARIRRNAAIAAGNLRSEEAVPALCEMLGEADSVLRAAAAWALGEVGSQPCRDALSAALREEPEPAVREEIQQALAAAGLDGRARGGK